MGSVDIYTGKDELQIHDQKGWCQGGRNELKDLLRKKVN